MINLSVDIWEADGVPRLTDSTECKPSGLEEEFMYKGVVERSGTIIRYLVQFNLLFAGHVRRSITRN